MPSTRVLRKPGGRGKFNKPAECFLEPLASAEPRNRMEQVFSFMGASPERETRKAMKA